MTAPQMPAPAGLPAAGAGRTTVVCVECGTRGHPLQIITRSYCEHRTCMRGRCWDNHPRTCPAWLIVTGRAEPSAPAVPRAAGLGGGPTPQAAAWIRKHAWTQPMRKQYREVPAFFRTCACQSGPTHWCGTDRHDRCHRAEPQRTTAAIVCGPDGITALAFPEPYEHPTDDSATEPQHEHAAFVWLADRVCRWVCPCDCHAAVAAPVPVQGELFEVAA